MKSLKVLLLISLGAEPRPCLKATPSLSPYLLPSLISSCSILSFGTQGRSWRLESVPYKHGAGGTEWLLCPGALQGPAQFPWDSESGWVSTGSRSVWTLLGTGHESLLLVRKARSRDQQEPLLVEG